MHISLNGCKIFFEVYGSKFVKYDNKLQEKPTFIFLHGGSFLDHSPYVNFWSRFSDVAQVIFIDHRGCGRSDLSEEKYWNLKQWGQDVYHFCQALNISNPIVGGISFGGYIALSYLTQFANHPRGLVLTDTEAHVSKERFLNIVYQRCLEKGLDPKPLVDVSEKMFTREFSFDLFPEYMKVIRMFGKEVEPIDDFNHVTCLSLKPSHVFGENEIFTFDFREQLKSINVPMLYMATDDAPLHCLKNAEDLVSVYPKDKMQFELFENASSPTYDHEPERAEKLIRDFILALD